NTPLVAGEHNGEKYFAANFTTGTYIFNDDFTLRAGPIMDGGSLIDHDALFWVNGELHGLIQGVYDKMDADGASVGWKDILPASSKASKKMVFSLDNSENNVRILTYNSIDASMSVVNPETLEAEQVYSVTGQTDAPPQITYINNIPHAIRSFDNNRVDILNLVDKSVSTINNGDAISSDIAVGTIDESEGSDVFFTNVSRSVWQLYDANSGLESSISNISQSNIGAPRGAHDMDNDGLYEVVVFNGSDISVVGYATVLPPPELLNFQGRDNPSFDEGIDFSWDIPPGAVLDSIGLYLNGNKVQNLSGDATSLTFSEGIQHNIPYSAQVASYMNGLATFSGTQNVMSFGETITPYQKGDVDKNNKIDIFDLLETLKILSGSSNPDPEQQYLADIDGNERVDIFDLLGLLRLLSSGASLN
ncbi:MAG: dockerin type I repeat-containing protein, partial [Gemmatimonadota bacterium]|nr:dockerin type I repeat-containing protein [Gemmatimonadota bacterium]